MWRPVVWDLIKEKVDVLIKPIWDICRTHARIYARMLVYTSVHCAIKRSNWSRRRKTIRATVLLKLLPPAGGQLLIKNNFPLSTGLGRIVHNASLIARPTPRKLQSVNPHFRNTLTFHIQRPNVLSNRLSNTSLLPVFQPQRLRKLYALKGVNVVPLFVRALIILMWLQGRLSLV